MGEIEFSLDASELEKGLDSFGVRFLAALEMYGRTSAAYLASEAKENRPWTDRTSRARLGLTGSSDLEDGDVRIVLAHTVDYGLWLELAHEKNYAIVEPTVTLNKDKIVEGLETLLNGIKV